MINLRALAVAAGAPCLLLAALLPVAWATPGGVSAARSGAQPSAPARAGAAGNCPGKLTAQYGIVATQLGPNGKPSTIEGHSTIDMYGVAAVSANDVWIGGEGLATHALSGTSAYSGTIALIEHWDGKHWCVADSPPVAGGTVRSLAATGPADIWAVGDGGTGYAGRPLIEHWNGSRWALSPAQAILGVHIYSLSSVAAFSPSNAWAVGYAYSLGVGFSERQVVEHWDGHAWRLVSTGIEPRLQGYYRLNAVTTRSANDTWIVGQDTNTTGAAIAFAMHWDGLRWQLTQFPPVTNPFRDESLQAVAALEPRDVWAVGAYKTSNRSGGGPVAYHWNGTSWQRAAVPNEPGAASYNLGGWPLAAIAAVSPTDIWAIPQAGHALHWDGHGWQVITSSGSPQYSVPVSAASAVSTRDIWAVGPDSLTAYHWNGGRWSAVPIAPTG